MKQLIILIGISISIIGCTNNELTKKWGGKQTIKLEPNHILLNVTWKEENSMWILTKDTLTNKCYFKEHSQWGLLEGQIQFE
mgnify:FL=1